MTDNSDVRIFLLSPEDLESWSRKIIWADNEDEARNCALVQSCKIKNPGQPVEQMSLTIYQDQEKTACEDISSEVQIVERLSTSYIKVSYSGKEFFLTKRHAEVF